MTPPDLPRGEGALSSGDDLPVLIQEVQLLLAEKRTALSVMRTGIAICALPLSVMSVLIATSKFYDASTVLHLLVPVMAVNALLTILAVYLVVAPCGGSTGWTG